ncbi:MAG: hypothetical protein AAFY98_11500 [Verrucomicrobiota bacterium]
MQLIPQLEHYQSPRQVELWNRVHNCYVPMGPAESEVFYRNSFSSGIKFIHDTSLDYLTLGAGSGWKEAILGETLGWEKLNRVISIDAAEEFVHQTREVFIQKGYGGSYEVEVGNLNQPLNLVGGQSGTIKMVTAFGLIPNMEPEQFFTVTNRFTEDGDYLWLSANLMDRGQEAVLAQYANKETEDWLSQWFRERQLSGEDYEFSWSVENQPFGYQIQLAARFLKDVEIGASTYSKGESILVFFTNRMRSDLFAEKLRQGSYAILFQEKNKDDGVWLCKKKSSCGDIGRFPRPAVF